MALVASCDGLYFTDLPVDNILTLTWESPEDTPLAPYSFVLFKVKSTAPMLFHVLPRYGSLLLCGESPVPSPVSTRLTISLRDTYRTGQMSENGLSDVAATARPSSSVPGQERFSVEYILITGEEAAYGQLALSPSAAKTLWAQATTGKLCATGISSIPLMAFTENVTTDVTRAGEPNVVIVPPTATLTRPALHEHAMSRISVHTQESATGTNSQRPRPLADGELRALKSGIEALRQVRYSGRGEQEQDLLSARGRGREREREPMVEESDIVMRATQVTWEERKMQLDNAASQRGGIPLVFVLLAMLATYICVMLAWRERGQVTSSAS